MDIFALLLFNAFCFVSTNEDERLPNKCEVCKFLSVELQDALEKTGRSREVLEVGEVLDSGKRRRRIRYNTSETRLTEAIDNICEGILQYSVHAERPGSLRYAKGASQTMTTLKNLVHKGVKVDLGLPYELWDEPSVEVTDMKKQCETMLERYEEVVEDWYFHHQDQRLESFLCQSHVLQESERGGRLVTLPLVSLVSLVFRMYERGVERRRGEQGRGRGGRK
ncbi:protein canopy 4 isoform X2 [Antennarius striatus]|uniref:protein canopy 4 isoform X2 n=1 Tax=Antennarius striatus TaxID=241820 RepID=UPI0035AF0579